jgi:hypothetical protein
MANLRSQLNTLAADFANQIMAASLHELVSSGGGGNGGNSRHARVVAGGNREAEPISTPPTRKGKNGRFPRRSGWQLENIWGCR